MSDTKSPLPLLLLCLIALIWGSSFILMKLGLNSFAPLTMAALRLTIAGFLVAPFAWKFRKKVSRKDIAFFFLLGVMGNGITAFLFATAETVISSASAGILNTLTPIFILLGGWLFFGMKYSSQKAFGVFTGIGGALILILIGDEQIDLFTHAGYSLMVVLATFLYATNTNMVKRYYNHVSPVLISSFSLLLLSLPAAIILIGFTDFTTQFSESIKSGDLVFWQSFGAILVLGGLGTALAVVLYNKLLQLTDPVVAGSLAYLLPVVALFWAFLAGETLGWGHFGGMALIFAGLYFVRKG